MNAEQRQAIAAAVAPVVEGWLRTLPFQPLVLRVNPAGDGVEARIGLKDSSCVTGKEASEILGMSYKHFARSSFFGLRRGANRKFSRLQVERLKQRRSS